MTNESYDLERFGRILRARREELGIQQEDLDRFGGPSSTTLSQLERGITRPSPKTLRKLDTGLRWVSGSARRTLEGGDPEVLPQVRSPLPRLPRDAPNAPVLSEVDRALGIHPTAAGGSLEFSNTERAYLVSARNKLMKGGASFTGEETAVLTRFIEDDELRTLHVRIDWLPRAEQLEVSGLVNELQLRLEERCVADGYSNESDTLPDYAQPNPLPFEGIGPADVRRRRREGDNPNPEPL